MKLRIALLTLSCLLALPAMGQAFYDHGPINGNTDAWTSASRCPTALPSRPVCSKQPA